VTSDSVCARSYNASRSAFQTMKILISNDDGYQAPGIVALYEALQDVAEVEVVAPEHNNSAKSNALTLHSPLYVHRAANGFRYVNGTPADCVRVGLHRLCPEATFVLSGINHGGNLGADVYYSGTRDEVTDRFLKFWPDKPNAVSRACNSNHEMYTGGRAYFKETLKKFGQIASYFALQNDHWLLVGLDSAYEEAALAHDQVAWLKGLLANAGDRRVVLFTHHQLFSWAETAKGKMPAQLGELLVGKKIFAWYWGHEHRCMLFDQHPAWNIYGRCIGHSGYPYFRDTFTEGSVIASGPQDTSWRKVDLKNMVPGGLMLEGPNPYVKGDENDYGPNGYLTLEFDDDRLNEIVHTPNGEVAFERQLV